MAKEKKAANTTRTQKKKANKWLVIVCLLTSMVLFKTTTIFVVMGMLPSIVAYYADVSSSKKYFRSLAACNLSGIIPYAADMMARGNTSSTFIAISTNLTTWLIIFTAAASGWVLMSVCPSIARLIIDLSQRGRVVQIENTQRRLVEEWGVEIQRSEIR